MTEPSAIPEPASIRPFARLVTFALLTISAVFFALHFVHLNADFPNNSPWMDWAKYTDEGWYGDAAIRHYLSGHWYFEGDFNPAVALPLWPALELVFFKLSGVSAAAARVLTLGLFALTVATFYLLIQRHTRPHNDRSGPPLAAPVLVLFLCCSPYLYVFERMAILEPLLIALTALALLAAGHLHPFSLSALHPNTKILLSRPERSAVERPLYRLFAHNAPTIFLALLLPAIILTKTTGICLFPAIFYMVWARAGYRIRPALRLAVPPAAVGLALWCAYYFGFVRPHYLEDYAYLFSANAYTGIGMEPLFRVVLNTLADGGWMGHVLYPAFFVVLAMALFWRPRLFTNPLVPALLLWIGGYFAFLAYHNNLQPRYYLVVAVPITAIVALGIDNLRHPATPYTPGTPNSPGAPFTRSTWRMNGVANTIATLLVLAIALPDAAQQLDFVLHPTYQFRAAADGIRQIVLADTTHPHLVLSISGSDLTLMTGLPSIDDDFGTLDLDKRVNQYRPGWYAAWNEVEDDKADAITPLYRMVRVAAFPAYDDPDRNLLILYRLDPAAPTPAVPSKRHHIPKALVTKLGQQPSTTQLEH